MTNTADTARFADLVAASEGVAATRSRLAKTALEYAREHRHQVIPACVFMKVYIRRHPEYKELIPR